MGEHNNSGGALRVRHPFYFSRGKNMLCIIDGPRSQNSGSRSELRINMSAQFHLLSASRGLNPQGHAVYFHKHFLFFF